MRIIHTSDFHLGAYPKGVRGGNVDTIRVDDFFGNLGMIVEYAIERDIDALLISGDVFHSYRPSPDILVRFSETIAPLISRKIPIIITAGNHDIPRGVGRNPLEALYKVSSNLFYYIEHASALKIETKSGLLGIVNLPYLDPKILRAHNLSLDKYPEFLEARVKEEYEKIKGLEYRVLMAHLFIRGASYHKDSGFYTSDIPVDINFLHPEWFNYIALGHIHTPQKVADNAYYAGSIERLTFSEINESRSFYLIDLDTMMIDTIPLKCRPMISTDTIVIETPISAYQMLINELDSIEIPEGALVKIKLIVSKPAWDTIRMNFIAFEKYILEDRGALGYKLDREILYERVERVKEKESEGILSMFEAYIEERFRNYPEGARNLAIKIGKKMIMGGELET